MVSTAVSKLPRRRCYASAEVMTRHPGAEPAAAKAAAFPKKQRKDTAAAAGLPPPNNPGGRRKAPGDGKRGFFEGPEEASAFGFGVAAPCRTPQASRKRTAAGIRLAEPNA